MTKQTMRLLQRMARRFTPVHIDARVQPAELYYARIYLDEIGGQLKHLNGKHLRVLDAGCGTGRLMVPIAQMGHELTGIDYHHDSLRLAREHLKEAGRDAELIESDLVIALQQIDDNRFDAAMAIESIYVSEQYETILDHLTRIVRPGGLLFITHRTRFFYLLRALRDGKYEEAEHIATHPNAWIHKGMHRVYHHWQTRSRIEAGYANRGLTLLKLHAIGLCSGFGDDPLTGICDPGTLDGEQRRVLHTIESCDDDLLMAGRYVFAVVRK